MRCSFVPAAGTITPSGPPFCVGLDSSRYANREGIAAGWRWSKEDDMAVRVELSRILIHENSPQHVVELREADGDRVLPIWIGLYEAAAIERRLMGQTPPRPQTHELLDNVIRQLGWQVESIVISDFKAEKPNGGTFFARLVLRQGEKTMDIDSRPSDAIALGCAGNVPIFVEERVFEQVSRAAPTELDNPPPEPEGDLGEPQ